MEQKIHQNYKNNIPFLRPLTLEDIDQVLPWFQDPFLIAKTFMVPNPKSIPRDFGQKSYAKKYFFSLLSDPTRRSYGIIYANKLVGTVGLKSMNLKEKTAFCHIDIGDRGCRGQGIGRKAMELLLYLAQVNWRLDTIFLDVLEYNLPAIKLYTGLGFSLDDRLAWHFDEFGQYWKVLGLSLSFKNI